MSATPTNPYGRTDPTRRDAWDAGFTAGQYEAAGLAGNERRRRDGIEAQLVKECNAYASAIGPLTMERDDLKARCAELEAALREHVIPFDANRRQCHCGGSAINCRMQRAIEALATHDDLRSSAAKEGR